MAACTLNSETSTSTGSVSTPTPRILPFPNPSVATASCLSTRSILKLIVLTVLFRIVQATDTSTVSQLSEYSNASTSGSTKPSGLYHELVVDSGFVDFSSTNLADVGDTVRVQPRNKNTWTWPSATSRDCEDVIPPTTATVHCSHDAPGNYLLASCRDQNFLVFNALATTSSNTQIQTSTALALSSLASSATLIAHGIETSSSVKHEPFPCIELQSSTTTLPTTSSSTVVGTLREDCSTSTTTTFTPHTLAATIGIPVKKNDTRTSSVQAPSLQTGPNSLSTYTNLSSNSRSTAATAIIAKVGVATSVVFVTISNNQSRQRSTSTLYVYVTAEPTSSTSAHTTSARSFMKLCRAVLPICF